MKRINFFILFIIPLFVNCQIINIPMDYPTIQQGVDAANNGDTVLVDIGTYTENINFNGKDITVASHYLITLDPIYITQTVINGGQNGTVVIFENGENNSAVLNGFTITNGFTSSNGGGIKVDSASPILEYLNVSNNECEQAGGGIYLNYSNSILKNLSISDNESVGYSLGGGGIFLSSSNITIDSVNVFSNFSSEGGGISAHDGSNLIVTNSLIIDNVASSNYSGYGGGINITYSIADLQNTMISNNIAIGTCGPDGYGGGIYCLGSNLTLSGVSIIFNESDFVAGGLNLSGGDEIIFDSINRCSIYSNFAPIGHEIAVSDNSAIKVVVDTFSVMNPTDYYAEPSKNIEFDINYALISQLDNDLFVSPYGDNSNSGLYPEDALRNIQYALSILRVDSLYPQTIHLIEGTYSPSETEEYFPINIPDYCNLIGLNTTQVILSAEGTNPVINISSNSETSLSGMTITDGVRKFAGGGIGCSNSDPVFSDLIIDNNVALDLTVSSGGGLHLMNSNPILKNIQITNNYALSGGAVSMSNSSPTFTNVSISGNEGGGIRIIGNSHPILENTIMWNDLLYEIGFWSSNSDSSSVSILNSDIQGGLEGILYQNENDTVYWLDGNLNEDPKFALSGDHPFALTELSPCIDAGTSDTTGLSLPPWDIIGNIRLWDGDNNGETIVDMGAYEFGSPPVGIDNPIVFTASQYDNYKLYPNPTQSTITIELPTQPSKNTSLTISNTNGQQLITQPIIEPQTEIDISHFPSGIYIVKVWNDKEVMVRKVIKR